MKSKHLISAAIASVALSGVCFAQAAPKPGLAAILDNDDKVIAEVVGRNMTTLKDYLFKKNNVPKDRQEAYEALVAVSRINDPDLKPSERARLSKQVAAGIDKVLLTLNDPVKLMALNKQLVTAGTQRPLNILEYWPEGSNPKVQAQLQPIAQAVDRVYEKAVDIGQKEADRIANQMTPANQSVLAPQWEKVQNLVGLAKYSRAYNLYVLALSMDKADPKRAETALKGVEMMKEYENPDFEIPFLAKLAVGKLYIAAGPQSVGQAKAKLAEIIKDPKAPWPQKFEAMYFTSVAAVVEGNFPEAQKAMGDLDQWLKTTPPPGEDDKQKEATLKGTAAAMDMLQYRILSAQAEAAKGADKDKLNAQAMGILTRLAASRPDLSAIISEQMMARLPDEPNVAQLDPLMLRAMVHKADDELVKGQDQAVDQKVLRQAASAAREIIRHKGKEGISADDVELATISLPLYFQRLSDDVASANAFLDYLELFTTGKYRELAYEGALSAVGRLQRDRKGDVGADKAYMRFLEIATARPLEKREFNLEYGTLLVKRNVAIMEGQLTPEQRSQAIANANRAIQLLNQVPDASKQLYAQFYGMLAYDQLIDLEPKSAQLPSWIQTIQHLGDQINAELAKAPAGISADALRLFKVRTSMLIANLAEHAQGAERKKSMEHALALLANFEKDVEGLPNAQQLLGEVRELRIKFLMGLDRSQEALDDLAKFVESAGDRSIPIIYEMLKSLSDEYHHALENKEDARADELAAQRAIVSRFMVKSVANSKNADTRKLLPKFEAFQAEADLEAARREKDPTKRKDFLASARAVFDRNFKANPDDRETELKLAVVEYELGNYESAQEHLGALINQNLLGKPKIQARGSDDLVWNDLFWQGRLMLLQSITRLVEQKAKGFGPDQLEDVKRDLKRLYIQWGEPGGPKFFPEFDKLRQQLIPDWTPPPSEEAAPATQPAATKK